jgi:hypothetical protein
VAGKQGGDRENRSTGRNQERPIVHGGA